MSIKIYFDLDGTVYNLYGVNNWLARLRNEDATAYNEGEFLHKETYNHFLEICSQLSSLGVQFGVITWLAMQSSPEYEEEVTEIKREWVEEYLPFVTEFNAQSYGIPKQNAIQKRAKRMYLIDDSTEVCEMWQTNKQRIAINVNDRFTALDALIQIFNEITGEG